MAGEIQRTFTVEQIIQLLATLGSDVKEGSDGTLMFRTVCHNPPHTGSYKLYYYPETGKFHCYTECGDSFDVYTLVCRALHCDFRQALEYLQTTLHLETAQPLGLMNGLKVMTGDWELLERYASRAQPAPLAPYEELPPSLLGYYAHVTPVEWEADGIPPQVMEKFGIRFHVAENEAIIPHYDMQGRLIGIRARSFDPAKVAAGCKYMPAVLQGRDYRHSLKNNLYGLHLVRPGIEVSGKIMLCEGEKSVMQSYAMYGDRSFTVAICGSSISTAQRDLVLSLGVREVFLALDKEYHTFGTPESRHYAEKLIRLAQLFTPYATTYVLYDTEDLLNYKDSPTDRGREVLEQLMRTKFEVETTVPDESEG